MTFGGGYLVILANSKFSMLELNLYCLKVAQIAF